MRYPLATVSYGAEEIDAVVATLCAGRTTAGPRVAAFERTFAEYVGRKCAVMVNSGSSADLLLAYGIEPVEDDDEILVPAVTWPTQVSSCLAAGFKVRLVDVDPATLQFDLADVKRKMNPAVRAIFPVHVLGNVGEIEALADFGVPVIEDCCEALGSTVDGQHVGTFGTAASFSFFFSHLISTMEGGMVVSDANEREYRLTRTHGWEPAEDEYFHFPSWGFNFRPTELQGAFGSVQMTHIKDFLAARKRNYDRLLGVTAKAFPTVFCEIKVRPGVEPAWHGFPLMVNGDRKTLCRYLTEHGVETRPIVAGNLARQPAAIDDPSVFGGLLPGADQVHERGFYIGLASHDDEEGIAYVGQVLSDFLN